MLSLLPIIILYNAMKEVISAKRITTFFQSRLSNISFIINTNRVGPRTLPWGTPLSIDRLSEFRSISSSLTLTICVLPDKYDLIQLWAGLRIPYFIA